MTFLPIVDRELRVRARQSITYKARGIGGLLAVAFTCFLLMFSSGGATVGTGIFTFLSTVTFAFCLLEGLRNTTDCLSEEKRAGTLGFLFLTDLKGYDVVLGKLIATSLNSFYMLFAILPAFALPLLVGGVTPGEFWRLVLVLLETLFFSLCVGMFVSASSRSERHAWATSVGLVCFWATVPPLIKAIPYTSAPWIEWLSPTIAFRTVSEAAYKTGSSAFWHAITGTGMLSLLLLALAAYVLPRTWQDQPRVTVSQGALTRELFPQAARAFSAAEKRVLDENPVSWLMSRSGRQQTYLWLLVGICGSFALLVWLPFIGWSVLAIPFVVMAVGLHYVLAVWVGFNACYTLSDAKSSGLLELLFSTPLKATQIVDGFLLGLKRQFFGPVVTLLWIEAAVLVSNVFYGIARKGALELNIVLFVAGAMIVAFVMDLYAVAIFGMWTALHAKKPGQAFTKTVVLVLLLPTLLGLCCLALPITAILKNMIFLSYKQALYERFRRLVSDPGRAWEHADIPAKDPRWASIRMS